METSLISMVFQSLLALAAVLGIFALMVWAMRRVQQQTGSAGKALDFKVIQRIHIDSKNSIIEVRHRGSHYLLGLSPGGLTQLRPDQALSASDTTSSSPDESL
ncbi:MAG: hypothetical protein CO187_09700 [Zetaproteobacteria bacterium CG_4_9_14_3_um_filter_53_7]|nr:MAG: hypothetical protein CO187_09700 [Zetaproteobacteria bacterium CG_4_9_14_3_um_filter_53_7]